MYAISPSTACFARLSEVLSAGNMVANLCEQRTYLCRAFQCPLWSDEHRIVSIISHNRLDIAGSESLPVMKQYLSRLFSIAQSHLRFLPNGFRFYRAADYLS